MDLLKKKKIIPFLRKGHCFTCKFYHRKRALCVECNTSYELRRNAQWERVGWEPSERYLEIMEEYRIGNKEW